MSPLSEVYPNADIVLDLGIVGVVVELSLFRCLSLSADEDDDDDDDDDDNSGSDIDDDESV